MRCAGYNNISLRHIKDRFKVVRVPAYSPYSIAEYTMGMILALNRKIDKAYVRRQERGTFQLVDLWDLIYMGKLLEL